jgi:predicted nuclease with RNAse H fold
MPELLMKVVRNPAVSSISEPRSGAGRSAATPDDRPLVVGIDLRSGPRYPTGLAVLDGSLRLQRLEVIRSDDGLLAAIEEADPALVAIDAPLGLPEGRCCTSPDCDCARHGIMREADRVCAAAGYRPFPTLLPSMVKLTERGIRLHGTLTDAGYEVIEVYPGMAQDILGIPRKGTSVDALRRGLKRAGIRGIPRKRRVSHDELDAATCALVARLHLEGATETMGPGVPVPLVLPRRAGERSNSADVATIRR